MSTTTFNETSGSNDGGLSSQVTSSWTAARAGATAVTQANGGAGVLINGAYINLPPNTYICGRAYFSWDTAATIAGGTVSAAHLTVTYKSGSPYTAGQSVGVFVWTKTGASAALNASSWSLVGASCSAQILMADIKAAGGSGYQIALNSTGLAAIKATGTDPTRFAILSSNDFNNTPPTLGDTSAGVLVNYAGSSTDVTLTATYGAAPVNPTFSSISPTTGVTTGGTPFTIAGTGFVTGATVTIGGAAATGITVVSAISITGTTGAHPAVGLVNVVITNTDGGHVTATNAFTYTATTPHLTSVSPPSGTASGGTSVTLTGTGFSSGGSPANGVTFGGSSATSVVVLSDTTITCTTPAHASGAVNIVVTNPNSAGTSTLTNGYTYTITPPVFSDTGSQLFYDFTRGIWYSGAYGSLTMLASDPTQGAPKIYALTAAGDLLQVFDESVPDVPSVTSNIRRGFLQTMPINLGNMTTMKQFHGFVMVVNDVTAITVSGGVTAPWQAFLYVDNANQSTPPLFVPLIVNIEPYNTMPVGTIEGGNQANNSVGELIGYFNTTSGGPVTGHNAYLEIYYPQGTPANTPTSGVGGSGPLHLPWSVYRIDMFCSMIGESRAEP